MKNELYNLILKAFSLLIHIFLPLILLAAFKGLLFSMVNISMGINTFIVLLLGLEFISLYAYVGMVFIDNTHILKFLEKYD